MTTARDIVTDALAELGVIGAGDSVPPEDAAVALRKLNQVLERWANHRLLQPYETTISVTLNGAASYTIGPSGVVVASRPLTVKEAFAVDSGGNVAPLCVCNKSTWEGISYKATTGGPPTHVWYHPTATNGTLYVFPMATGYTIRLTALTYQGAYALNDTVNLPEGYVSALTLATAIDSAGIFGAPVSNDLRIRSAAAGKSIKRTNTEPLYVGIDLGMSPAYQIERGY